MSEVHSRRMSKTLPEMISVMQAAQEGKAIECTLKGAGQWTMPESDCKSWAWDWNGFDYRVKPAEPRRLVVASVEFIELTPEIKAKLGL